MDQKILFEIKKFKHKKLPTAFFFTDRRKVTDFVKIIANLPKNSAIIIREYDLDNKKREIFARNIAKLAKSQNLKVLVGKDIELAKKIKANGVHFSDYDKIPLKFLKKSSFCKNFIFSFSCHNLTNIVNFSKINPDVIFISPIFKTTSHVGTKIHGLRNLAKISLLYSKLAFKSKIYALGGINLTNIRSLSRLDVPGFGAIDIFKN